jgi:hypothetical protein
MIRLALYAANLVEGVFSERRIYDPAVWERAVKGTEAALH